MSGYGTAKQVASKLYVENQELAKENERLRAIIDNIMVESVEAFGVYINNKLELRKLMSPYYTNGIELTSNDINQYVKEFINNKKEK